MVFEINGWKLYSRQVIFKDGQSRTIYFFLKGTPQIGVPCDIPKGFIYKIHKMTGLPYIVKGD